MGKVGSSIHHLKGEARVYSVGSDLTGSDLSLIGEARERHRDIEMDSALEGQREWTKYRQEARKKAGVEITL